MLYTKHGLYMTLDELKKLVENVENQYKYFNKEASIYITNETDPKIFQYSCYSDGCPTNHTAGTLHYSAE